MSNNSFVTATAKIARILYEYSAINAKGQFCNGWEYRCRNLIDELAYFTIENNAVHFICHLKEARKFCKFSENAWSLVENQPDTIYLRDRKVGTHGEHVVPVSLVQKILFEMLQNDCNDDQISNMLSDLVEVVFITEEERKLLDFSTKNGGLGLKTSMPKGWDADVVNYDFSQSNFYARLDFAGIKIAPDTIDNSIKRSPIL